MMEMSCRWWPIWYLLFFCHGAEGQLQWVVKEKVTAYGQNLILFCPVENCCSKRTAWSVGEKSIILDIKTFSNDPNVKYHGTYNKDGFSFVIRNLSRADLNVTYHCGYGFIQSTPKYLLYGDVFRESTRHLQWVVKKKVNAYGQNLILFCPVENCCSETAGWSVGSKSIISDVKTLSNDPNVRYHGTYNRDGFGVVIHNLSEADLNVTYSCVYGFNQSIPRKLLHDDVFKKSTDVPDKDEDEDEENNTETILLIVVTIVVIILVGAIIGIMYRIKKKRQKETGTDEERERLEGLENQQGTVEEMENLNGLDNEMENQQGTVEEMENLNGLDNEMENQQEIDQTNIREKERTEPEIPKTLSDRMNTFTAQSSTTEVVLCHREVKSGMITAGKEDYKKQKKLFEKFIKENKFYYDDRFLKKYKYNSRQ